MLLKFEILKAYRQKKLLVIFLLLLLVVGGLFYRNTLIQEELGKMAMEEVLPHTDTGVALQKDYDMKVEEVGMTPSVQEGYDNMKAMNTAIREWESAIHYKRWDDIPLFKKQFYETILQQNSYGFPYGDLQGVELEKEVELTNRLVELELPYGEDIYPLSTSNFMYATSSSFLGLYGILLLVLLFGDTVTSEFQHNTIRTLNTQTLTQFRILGSKLGLMMAISIFVWIGMGTLSFAAAFLFGTTGSFQYPVIQLTENSFTIIPIYQAIVQHGLLFLMVLLFVFCLLLFVSVIMRKLFSTLVVLLLIMITGIFTEAQFPILQTKWNPFFYFQIEKIIERPYVIGGYPSLSILVIYSFILFILCWYFVRKNVSFIKEEPVVKPYARGEVNQSNTRANLIFEWRKLKRQNAIMPLLVILVLLIGGGFFYFNFTKELKERDEVTLLNDFDYTIIAETEEKINNAEQFLSSIRGRKEPLSEEEKKQRDISEADVRGYKPSLNYWKIIYEDNRKTKQAWNEGNWSAFYTEYIKNIKWQGGDSSFCPGVQFMDITPTERVGLANFSYKSTVRELELLAERELRPVFPLRSANMTMYDRFPNPVDRLENTRWRKKVDSSGLFYLYLFYSDNLYIGLLLLLVFLFSAGFAAERGKKNTLSFLLTQPVKKRTIYFSKFGTPAGVTTALAICAVLMIVLIGTIGNRFGDWNFPILFYDAERVTAQEDYSGIMAQEGGFHFIDLGTYVTESTYLLVGVLLLSMALVLFISIFIQHQAFVLMIGAVLAIAGISLKGNESIASYAHLSPFTYMEVSKITNGELATLLNNSSITSTTGILVLLLWTSLLFGAGMFVFKRKAFR